MTQSAYLFWTASLKMNKTAWFCHHDPWVIPREIFESLKKALFCNVRESNKFPAFEECWP